MFILEKNERKKDRGSDERLRKRSAYRMEVSSASVSEGGLSSPDDGGFPAAPLTALVAVVNNPILNKYNEHSQWKLAEGVGQMKRSKEAQGRFGLA
jgi:hypothetical protein